MNTDVALVLTSCGRLNLLKTTLSSFEKYNTYDLKEAYIIEDSANYEILNNVKDLCGEKYSIIFNDEKLGQIPSIDKVYKMIKSPYIFHCEDDWEFFNEGFIEESLSLLENTDDKILQVWLREEVDSPHPVLKDIHVSKTGNYYKKMNSNWNGWCGFSWNPGLRKTEDFNKIGSYSLFGSEMAISLHYVKEERWVAKTIKEYCRHIGYNNSLLAGKHYDK